MLSKACEYGIRALIFVVSETDGKEKKIDIAKISEAIDSPHHFTAKILQQLTRAGVISSLKGPSGGFFSHETTSSFSVFDVIEIMGGSRKFSSCVLGLHECSEEEPCPLHEEYKPIRKELNDLFKKTTLGDLSQGLNKDLSFLK